MTELMKRYEAETGEIATWIWHNKELVTDDVLDWVWGKMQTLEAKNAQLKSHISTIEEQLCDTIEEVYALKDQLRWRPVNERPKKDGKYFVTLEDSLDAGTFENDTIIYTSEAKYVDGKWDIPAGLRFIRWLPIPPAP